MTIVVRSHQSAAHQAALQAAANGDPDRALPTLDPDVVRSARCRDGCTALHWAAGGDHAAACRHLVERLGLSPDVRCTGRAAGRTPLHYAARNGALAAARYLVHGAHADPRAAAPRGVTPFQLAVFQNRRDVCRWMVSDGACGVVAASERNEFQCGAAHWLAICPRKGSNNDSDSDDDLVATAEWLREQGCDFRAVQKQGHTALHKAAWKGHLVLIEWMHTRLDMWDDQPDHAGNYAADLARMAGHDRAVDYLRRHCSRERAQSCAVLGIALEQAGDLSAVRRAYLRQAQRLHPDRKQPQPQPQQQQHQSTKESNGKSGKSINSEFDALRRAYHHLTVEEGRGTQHNPAHSLKLLLQEGQGAVHENENDDDNDETKHLKARLTAVLLEFGDKGVYVCNLPKKWRQVWGPDVPFPFAGKPGGMGLTEALRTHCSDVVELRRDHGTHAYRAYMRNQKATRLSRAIRAAATASQEGDGGGQVYSSQL